MPYVNLPPGCRSLQMEDGKRYVAGRSGGRVEVSAEHAAAIDRLSGNGDAGLVGRAAFHEYGSVRKSGAGLHPVRVHRLPVVGGMPEMRLSY